MNVTTSDIDRVAYSLATMLNEWFSGPKPSHDVGRLESMIAQRMRRIVGSNDKDARIAELEHEVFGTDQVWKLAQERIAELEKHLRLLADLAGTVVVAHRDWTEEELRTAVLDLRNGVASARAALQTKDEGPHSKCSECGKTVSQVILCDEDDRQWCRECFAKTACAASHGEGCATLVTETLDAGAALKTKEHASDCALHNEPAFRAGPCDCGADAALQTKEGEGQ